MSPKEAGTLQIDEDMNYQRRSWMMQRFWWVVIALLLLAAILGLLGGEGPLNKAVAGTKGGPLWVEYHRFMRVIGPAQMTIYLNGLRPDERTVRLMFDGHFLDAVGVDEIAPEPHVQMVATGGAIYEFEVAEGTTAIEIRMDIKPERFGLLRNPIAKVGGPGVVMQSFVYP